MRCSYKDIAGRLCGKLHVSRASHLSSPISWACILQFMTVSRYIGNARMEFTEPILHAPMCLDGKVSHLSVSSIPTYHYSDVIMKTIASLITSLAVVYSTVYSNADQRKHQSSASLAFVWGIHRDRWIPRTKGQLRGKCFHLMTSSCTHGFMLPCYVCLEY